MIRILIAAADPAWAQALAEGFQTALAEAVQLEIVSGALYALTSLERHKADLVISGEVLDDMDGRDLYDLVSDDAALRQVPFILLSATGGDLILPDHQLILRARANAAETLAAAFTLLLTAGKLSVAPAFGRDYLQSEVKVSGTLEALTLFDLVVSLGQGKRSGRLVVLIGDLEGTLYLRGGRLIHATFAETTGEDALQEIFARVHHEPTTPFLFVGGVPAKTPKTICTSLDKLLLQVAVGLDEQGVAA